MAIKNKRTGPDPNPPADHKLLEELKQRFNSGNDVPVERIHLKREEFASVLRLMNAALHQE